MIETMVTDPEVKDPAVDPDSKDQTDQNQNESDDTSLTKNSDSSEPPSWHKTLPKALIGNEKLKDYASLGDAAQALIDMRTREPKVIELLGENATPEQTSEYHKKLGRPDGPEGYGLKKPSDWPEGAPWDDGVLQTFAQNAFASGLTVKQTKELFAQDIANATRIYQGRAEGMATQRKVNQATLLEMAGGDQEKVKEILQESEQAFRTVGSPELLQLFQQFGLHEHPLVIESYRRAYAAVKDDKFFQSREQGLNQQLQDEPWRKVYENKTNK